jgi:hypothetical protein
MADLAALLDTYAGMTDEVRRLVTEYARQRFNDLGSWRDADVQRFLDEVLPAILAGTTQVGALTEGFLSTFVAEVTGDAPSVRGVVTDYAALRSGIDPSIVYTRPFVTMRKALADGATLERAIADGLERLDGTVQADFQLAERATALQVIGPDDRVIGYRRALRPGASTSGSCGLCLAAASQRYRKGTLLPIHNRCHCKTVPVFREADPAVALNRRRFDAERARLREAGGDTSRSGLTRIRVREHGELGPVLTEADQHFTTAAEIGSAA